MAVASHADPQRRVQANDSSDPASPDGGGSVDSLDNNGATPTPTPVAGGGGGVDEGSNDGTPSPVDSRDGTDDDVGDDTFDSPDDDTLDSPGDDTVDSPEDDTFDSPGDDGYGDDQEGDSEVGERETHTQRGRDFSVHAWYEHIPTTSCRVSCVSCCQLGKFCLHTKQCE